MLFIPWTCEDAIEENTNKTPLSKIALDTENTSYFIITEIDCNICLRWQWLFLSSLKIQTQMSNCNVFQESCILREIYSYKF